MKKGFTLVELLAVILLLGVVAMIAIPNVSKIIEESKIKAAELSVDNYIRGVKELIAANNLNIDLNENEVTKDYTLKTLKTKGLDVEGKISNAIVTVNASGKIIHGAFCINGLSVDYIDGKAKYDITKDYCVEEIRGTSTLVNSFLATGEELAVVPQANYNSNYTVIPLLSESMYDDERAAYMQWQYRRAITDIHFVDYIDLSNAVELIEGGNYWDLSEERDESIIGWIEVDEGPYNDAVPMSNNINNNWERSSKKYKLSPLTQNPMSFYKVSLYIGSENYIYAPKDCTGLFSHMQYINLIEFDNFYTDEVEIMDGMFGVTGSYSEEFEMDVSSFNTSNVTSMWGTFSMLASDATKVRIDGLSNWSVDNVETMEYMFYSVGHYSELFYIDDISSWSTVSVVNMEDMFRSMAYYADYFLDLRSWDVSSVIFHSGFNDWLEDKILSPFPSEER